MVPMRTVFLGLLLVVFDINLGQTPDFPGVDVLPDVIGWLVVAFGLAPLGARHRGFTAATYASFVAALASVALMFTRGGGEAAVAGGLLESVSTLAALWFMLTGVAELATTATPADIPTASGARTLRVLMLLITVVEAATVVAKRGERVGAGDNAALAAFVIVMAVVGLGRCSASCGLCIPGRIVLTFNGFR